MRIIFFGATEIGYQCCKQLFDIGENVVGICSIPQEFSISYSTTPVKNVTFRSFESLAENSGVPLIFITTKMSDPKHIETIKAWRPDFALAIGWYFMVPRVVRDLFPLGIAGIHASLLPKYRGGSRWCGQSSTVRPKTGVTLFYFDDGVDTGEIIFASGN